MNLRRVPVVLAVILLWIPLTNAVAVPKQKCKGLGPRGEGWTTITLPREAQPVAGVNLNGINNGKMISYAISTADPSVIAYSTDNRILLSKDGGCSWDQVLDITQTAGLDATPPCPPATSNLASVDFVGEGDRKILVQVVSQAYTVPVTTCLIESADGGATWSAIAAGSGTPPIWLGYGEVIVSRSDPETVYATRSASGLNTGLHSSMWSLFVSHDAGESWEEPRPLPGYYQIPRYLDGGGYGGQCGTVDVNPHDPSDLWGWFYVPGETAALFHSSDEGKSWEPVDGGFLAEQAPVDVSVVASSKNKTTILATSSDYNADTGKAIGELYASSNGGKDWTVHPVPMNSWGMGCVEGNASGSHVMVTSAQDYAVTYRISDWYGFSVKDHAFTGEFAGDFQVGLSYVPGSGFYTLIYPLTGTDVMLAWYHGKGS